MSDEQEFATGGVLAFNPVTEWQGGCIVPALGSYVLETLGLPAAWGTDLDAPPLTINLDNRDAVFTVTGGRIEYGRAQAATIDDNAGG